MKMITFLAGVATGLLLARSGTGDALASRRSPRSTARTDSPRPAAGTGVAGRAGAGCEPDYPTHSPPRSDDELRERIRARVARTIHHPETIQVEVDHGCVILRGQVQARDAILLVAEVETTIGVTSVRNELEIQGALDEVAPPMTTDSAAVRAAERKTSHMT